jgi:hypothetical protein
VRSYEGDRRASRANPATQDFGDWLRASTYSEISKDDRSALIHIGEHEHFASIYLKKHRSTSPELIWDAIRDLVPSSDNPKSTSEMIVPNETAPIEPSEPANPAALDLKNRPEPVADDLGLGPQPVRESPTKGEHQMSKTLLAAALALAATVSPAPAVEEFFSATNLLKMCSLPTSDAKSAICPAYVFGIADTLKFLQATKRIDDVCIPVGTTGGQLVDVFVTHVRKSMADFPSAMDVYALGSSGSMMALGAFKTKWPCKTGRQP